MIDIGAHLIARTTTDQPKSYSEILLLLHEHKIISKELYDRIEKLSKLRNLLVYEYFQIDREILFKHSKTLVTDSEEFIKEIKHFIKGKKFETP